MGRMYSKGKHTGVLFDDDSYITKLKKVFETQHLVYFNNRLKTIKRYKFIINSMHNLSRNADILQLKNF